MAALVQVEVREGRSVWVNPDQIVKISDRVEGGSKITSVGGVETMSIHNADETVRRIQN